MRSTHSISGAVLDIQEPKCPNAILSSESKCFAARGSSDERGKGEAEMMACASQQCGGRSCPPRHAILLMCRRHEQSSLGAPLTRNWIRCSRMTVNKVCVVDRVDRRDGRRGTRRRRDRPQEAVHLSHRAVPVSTLRFFALVASAEMSWSEMRG